MLGLAVDAGRKSRVRNGTVVPAGYIGQTGGVMPPVFLLFLPRFTAITGCSQNVYTEKQGFGRETACYLQPVHKVPVQKSGGGVV